MKDIPQNIKIIVNSVGPVVIVVILFFVVGNFGIGKITEIRAQVSAAQKDRNILSQKANLLSAVSVSLGNSPDLATGALPEDNPSVAVISQLKNLSLTGGVSVVNIKGGPKITDPTGLNRIDITFDVDGGRSQIASFLKSLAGAAPIMVLDKVKMVESGGAARATVSIKSYWSPLPKTLPAVNSELSDLTPDEKNIIVKVSSLTQPVFAVIPAGTSGGKTDPFTP